MIVNQVFEFLKLRSAPLHCSINLSAQSLNHKSFVDFLIDKVSENPDIAESLTFELTETSIVKNVDVVKDLFDRLRALGCKIAIDDFGVGESSLQYLMALSVDVVKIDGSFIKQLEHSEKARSLVKAIVSICQSMDIETVGEFVENEAIFAIVRDLGVTYRQGYFEHIPERLSDYGA